MWKFEGRTRLRLNKKKNFTKKLQDENEELKGSYKA